MGLIYCRECGKKVSDKAETCIHCGAPINIINEKEKSFKSKSMGVALAFFLGFFAYIYSWKEDYYKFWLIFIGLIFLFMVNPILMDYTLYIGLILVVIIIIDFVLKEESDFYYWIDM